MTKAFRQIGLLALGACGTLLTSGCCCVLGGSDADLVLAGIKYPPVAAIVAIPAAHNAAIIDPDTASYDLDASGSTDSDGTIVKYDWDYEGDGTYDLLDGGVKVPFTYPEEGVYHPKVRVTDNDGLTDDATTDVTVGSLTPPTAQGTAASEGIGSTLADFDASTSFDTDGTIEQYDWDFDNNGSFEFLDGGATPTHDYGAFGTFTAQVRVTDNDGLTDTAPIEVTLTEPANVPPVAAVDPTPPTGNAPLTVSWSAAASTDSDGTIVQYDWDMDNDGTFEIINGGVTQDANYPTGGVFTVGVQVTDDDGATDTATNTVDVNNPPVAAVTPSPATGDAPLAVTWDASASTDSDGTIVQFDWDMDNDGTFEITDGGPTQPANYATGGIFTVGVQVTDDDGATDTATNTVDVNNPPVAAVSPSPPAGDTPLAVTWDASASTDSDGTIVQFDWDMDNDGTFEITDGGPTQPANYATGGIFTVGVRVTDDDGATDTATNTVDVNEPPVADLVPSPPSGNKPLLVSWSAAGSTDSDGTIVQFDWDMDNDGTFEITNGSTTQPATYPNIGTFTVGVRVTDDDGATDATTASVTVNGTPPIAALTVTPGDGDTPITEVWDASGSTDSDGLIVQFDWDMDNDGTFEIINGGSSQSVFYTSAGTETVVVRVIDDDSFTDTAIASVDLQNPPD